MGGTESNSAHQPERRTFVTTIGTIAMAGGLTAGYGAFAYTAGRFLFPNAGEEKGWVFVTEVARMKPGDSMAYRLPDGAKAAVTCMADTGKDSDFLALSSVCPHLGCQVHWEPHNKRFFCPCHNGVFTPDGKATEGPPAQAGQSLKQYTLKIDRGRLFMLVPLKGLPR